MIEVRFRPITETDWPQAVTRDRQSPQFRSGLQSTLALLDVELRALDATDVVIETGHRKSEIRLDGWPKADARVPVFPGVVLSFGSKFGSLRYLTDVFEGTQVWRTEARGGAFRLHGWEANLRAIALSLEALRAVDRYGVSRRGEQYRGWNELPSGIPMGAAAMTIEEAASFLEEHGGDARPLADWDPEFLKRLHKAAQVSTHPDNGGDDVTFARVNQAHSILAGYVR